MLASIIFVILVLVTMFLCGRFTANYAAQRGRSRGAWFLWGALFFPMPSIVLALLPPLGKGTTPPPPSAVPAAHC
jgi:hypothetical protein